MEKVPILPETTAVANALGLDPLGMLASGSLLLTVEPQSAPEIISALSAAGIPAARIGVITDESEEFILERDGGSEALPSFAVDEVARLFAEDQRVNVIIIGSTNARIGMVQGMDVLREGGSAIDAVIETIRHVEANPDEHSVGYSGLPNLLGEVELDASIMNGENLATGAVAGLQGYQDAIDLARTVMDELPHVLIVGAGPAGSRRSWFLAGRLSALMPHTKSGPHD